MMIRTHHTLRNAPLPPPPRSQRRGYGDDGDDRYSSSWPSPSSKDKGNDRQETTSGDNDSQPRTGGRGWDRNSFGQARREFRDAVYSLLESRDCPTSYSIVRNILCKKGLTTLSSGMSVSPSSAHWSRLERMMIYNDILTALCADLITEKLCTIVYTKTSTDTCIKPFLWENIAIYQCFSPCTQTSPSFDSTSRVIRADVRSHAIHG